MDLHLVVARPFGGLIRGDIVIDVVRVAEILGNEHARDVVRVVVPTKNGG